MRTLVDAGRLLARRLTGHLDMQVDVTSESRRIRAGDIPGRLALTRATIRGGCGHFGSPFGPLAIAQGRCAARAAVRLDPPRGTDRGDAEIANLYRELFMLARPDPRKSYRAWMGDFRRGACPNSRRAAGWAPHAAHRR
jgi:hypothetical protein